MQLLNADIVMAMCRMIVPIQTWIGASCSLYEHTVCVRERERERERERKA